MNDANYGGPAAGWVSRLVVALSALSFVAYFAASYGVRGQILFLITMGTKVLSKLGLLSP